MLRFLLDLVTVGRAFFMNRTNLALEILALRQQVAVLKRKRPRPKVSQMDWLFWWYSHPSAPSPCAFFVRSHLKNTSTAEFLGACRISDHTRDDSCDRRIPGAEGRFEIGLGVVQARVHDAFILGVHVTRTPDWAVL